MKTTDSKAALAEFKVIARALEKGIVPSKPLSVVRYDVLLDDSERILRAQVKYGDGKSSHSEGAVRVELRCRDYSKSKSRKTAVYANNEIDCILVYLPLLDKIVKLPDDYIGKSSVVLRYESPKSKQVSNLNLVEDLLW